MGCTPCLPRKTVVGPHGSQHYPHDGIGDRYGLRTLRSQGKALQSSSRRMIVQAINEELDQQWELVGQLTGQRDQDTPMEEHLSCRPIYVINVAPSTDPEQTLHQLRRDGITAEINRVEHGDVRVSIDASRAIHFLRDELIHA